MPHLFSFGLMLLAVLGLASSARANDPGSWPLSKIAVEDGAALRQALQAQRHSQDELDFALIAAAGKDGRRRYCFSWPREPIRSDRPRPIDSHR